MAAAIDNVFTTVAVVLILAIFFFGAIAILPQIKQASSLDDQLRELQGKMENTEREIARIQNDQRRFRDDPRFLEALARERQRVYPGELVFIFDDSKAQ